MERRWPIDDYLGTSEQYISFLEGKVKSLCHTLARHGLSPDPPHSLSSPPTRRQASDAPEPALAAAADSTITAGRMNSGTTSGRPATVEDASDEEDAPPNPTSRPQPRSFPPAPGRLRPVVFPSNVPAFAPTNPPPCPQPRSSPPVLRKRTVATRPAFPATAPDRSSASTGSRPSKRVKRTTQGQGAHTSSARIPPVSRPTHVLRRQSNGEATSNDVPRWKKEMDSFIDGISHMGEWEKWRQEYDLASLEQNHNTILHLLNRDRPVATSSAPSYSDANSMARLRDYFTKASQMKVSEIWYQRMNCFMDIVAVSWCEVMLAEGAQLEEVNAIMEASLTVRRTAKDEPLSPAYLHRLRRGVKWVNECIAGLIADGWRCRAPEVFLLSGPSVAQYLRWREASDSAEHLKLRLKDKFVDFAEVEHWVPYSIPGIIQSMTGLSLRKICKALGYNHEEAQDCLDKIESECPRKELTPPGYYYPTDRDLPLFEGISDLEPENSP